MLVRLNRVKTRTQHSMSVFCSALQWEIDPLYFPACQLVGNPYNVSSFSFSQINEIKRGEDKTAAYIKQLLKRLKAGDAESFPKALRSHSTRRSSAVKASSNTRVNLSDIAHHGRWTMDGSATLLEYIAETSAADRKVA